LTLTGYPICSDISIKANGRMGASSGLGITLLKINPSNADVVHILIQVAAQFLSFGVRRAFLEVD